MNAIQTTYPGGGDKCCPKCTLTYSGDACPTLSCQPAAASVGYDSGKVKEVVRTALIGLETLKIPMPVNLALNLQRAHAELMEAHERILRHES